MSDPEGHARFLAEIIAHPDDDGPRLVYADWLLERGDPYGELIQIECRLASLPLGHTDRLELRLRRAELRSAHPEWFGPHDSQRAFIEELELSLDGDDVRDLFQLRVLPRRITLTGSRRSELVRLLQHPTIAALESLAIHSDKLDELVPVLAREDDVSLPRLRALTLDGPISRPVVQALLASPVGTALEELTGHGETFRKLRNIAPSQVTVHLDATIARPIGPPAQPARPAAQDNLPRPRRYRARRLIDLNKIVEFIAYRTKLAVLGVAVVLAVGLLARCFDR
jgi:uncharacterized protein (TIGR02996 family)